MLTHKLRQCMEPLQSASQIIHVFQITVDMVNDTSFEGDMYCTCEDLNVDSTTIRLLKLYTTKLCTQRHEHQLYYVNAIKLY